MPTKKASSAFIVAVLAAATLLAAPAAFGAELRPSSPRKAGTDGKGSSILRTGDNLRTPAGSTQVPPPAPADSSKAGATSGATESGDSGGSTMDGVVRFIRGNATLIVAVLGGVLGVLLLVWIVGGRRRGKSRGDDSFAELGLAEPTSARSSTASGSQRFSSTKIQSSQVDRRLGGSLETTQVETDREYALVVEKEDLEMPPLPEDAAKGAEIAGEVDRIRTLIAARKYEEAFVEYHRHIEADSSMEFSSDLEPSLGEGLMNARQLEKAAVVLEHHLRTQPRKNIKPEVFFNLGYIHFMNRTLKKSRKFLKVFVAVEKNPEYVERARRILDKLESSSNLN